MTSRRVGAATAARALIVSLVVVVVVGTRPTIASHSPSPAARPSPAPSGNGLIAVELWNEECGGTDCFTDPEGVVLVRPDGRGARRLPLQESFNPRFSADGRYLAAETEASPDVAAGIAVGLWNARRFRYADRDDDALYEGMDWSPRSDQLVFAKTRLISGHPTRLIRVTAQTGRRRLLGTGRWPAWAPNGRWIAFVDVDGDASQVMIVRPDGRGRRTLTRFRDDPPRSSRITVARWSADGRKVLFRRAVWRADVGYRGNDRLFAVNVTTNAIARVASGSRPSKGLVSPDGRLLATHDAGGVYVARRDGTGRRRIMAPPQRWGVDGFTLADWQPVP
jgi:Tol biopolymer transport system component